MKTMNLLKSAAVIAAMAMSMAACNNEDVINDEQKSDKLVEVSLNCGGEIKDMGDVPMSRAEESNDLYYVQAYTLNENGSGICYAHGLFDNVNDMTIKLKESDKYFFRATMIEDAKEYVYSETKDSLTYYYYFPFNTELTNEFVYTGSFDYSSMGYGTATMGIDEGELDNYDRPILSRYFGESMEYTPSEGGVVDITMARTSFGVRFELENVGSDDLIWVLVEGSPVFNLTAQDSGIEGIFSFFNVAEAYFYDKMEDGSFTNEFSEEVNVLIYRQDAEGNLYEVAQKYVTFKRNMMKTLKITIADNTTGNNVKLDVESTDLLEDSEVSNFIGGVLY